MGIFMNHVLQMGHFINHLLQMDIFINHVLQMVWEMAYENIHVFQMDFHKPFS